MRLPLLATEVVAVFGRHMLRRQQRRGEFTGDDTDVSGVMDNLGDLRVHLLAGEVLVLTHEGPIGPLAYRGPKSAFSNSTGSPSTVFVTVMLSSMMPVGVPVICLS